MSVKRERHEFCVVQEPVEGRLGAEGRLILSQGAIFWQLVTRSNSMPKGPKNCGHTQGTNQIPPMGAVPTSPAKKNQVGPNIASKNWSLARLQWLQTM
jgi:hypothetical protein